MRRGASIFGALAAALVITKVRADAPPDQYSLFDASVSIIRDLQTKLAWQRRPPTTPVRWTEARDACAALSIDGVTGWRLPTYKELLTLVDEDYTYFLDAFGSPRTRAFDLHAFPEGQPATYWSSTRIAGTSSIWMVSFGTGESDSRDASFDTASYRCVRDEGR